MSNFDRPGVDPGLRGRDPVARSSNTWVIGVVVVLAILALGYVYRDQWMGGMGLTDHRAAATDTTTRTTTPAPAVSPTPSHSATP